MGVGPAVVSASVSGGAVVGSPVAGVVPGSADATVNAAIAALKEKRISGFLQLVAPPGAMDQMKSEWEAKRSEELPPGSDEEFKSFMGMVTADGAEDMLFSMARPYLKDAQEQLQGISMMLPMMAAGALQEADAPPEAGEMIGSLAQKVATLNIADEGKLKKAIGILCSSMRKLELNSAADMQALEFDELMGRADIAYGGLIDILGLYGLSPQETLDSMEVKLISTEGDVAQLEMTFSLFGMDPETVPFEMERMDGRWFPKEPVKDEQPESGVAR